MTADRHAPPTGRRPGSLRNQILIGMWAALDLDIDSTRSFFRGIIWSARRPAPEALPHLAVLRSFSIVPGTIAGDHVAPKRHRAGMTHVFDDFPFAGKAVENQG